MPRLPQHKLRRYDKGSRNFRLDLTDPRYDCVAEFRERAMPDRPMTEVVRELCLMALAADPITAAYVAARQTAYRAASYECRTILAKALREASEQMQAGITADLQHGGGVR
jgi:hypothetical protein